MGSALQWIFWGVVIFLVWFFLIASPADKVNTHDIVKDVPFVNSLLEFGLEKENDSVDDDVLTVGDDETFIDDYGVNKTKVYVGRPDCQEDVDCDSLTGCINCQCITGGCYNIN